MLKVSLPYKQVDGLEIYFDAYYPSFNLKDDEKVAESGVEGSDTRHLPAVVFFHGGGLTVGDRESWFPQWMHKRFSALGYLFISADYRLLIPSTGHDILADIQDLWAFITHPKLEIDFPSSESSFIKCQIERNAIAVAGVSAGGLCAYLCAMHCIEPRPNAILSLYGMGGDFMTPHYLTPKSKPFFQGRDLLDPLDPTLRPFVNSSDTPGVFSSLQVITGSPLSYHPPTHAVPGYPANPRMLLARLYLQLGTWLDYYLDEHNPSISEALHAILSNTEGSADELDDGLANKLKSVIPARHLSLFPQYAESLKDWPPTLLLHGTEDTAVSINESRNLFRLLTPARRTVDVDRLIEVPGAEHSFDLVPDTEEKYGELFDEVVGFINLAVSQKHER
ncbi:hypothetical protein D9611_014147 [Ephemerocybe angulata]|uniref:Alpha/beta hydrolase fold-3 domain-containing protein n=1 Tax=Ephemerocybe angulata TaxID=980116 RepID=A0A8H5FF86_9AGAR|nr:hypothetical protein D9611_014147 [Tulosesus angulatus]